MLSKVAQNLLQSAPVYTQIALLIAVICVLLTGLIAVRQLRKTRTTQRVARYLIETHIERIEGQATEAAKHGESLGKKSGQLIASTTALAESIRRLRWLTERIPEERSNFNQALIAALRALLANFLPFLRTEEKSRGVKD